MCWSGWVGHLLRRRRSHIEEINDALRESLLSYRESASDNELSLRHELSGRNIQITFDPPPAAFSCEGNNGKGAFRPRVEGDALEYGWENTTPCGVAKPCFRQRRTLEFLARQPDCT